MLETFMGKPDTPDNRAPYVAGHPAREDVKADRCRSGSALSRQRRGRVRHGRHTRGRRRSLHLERAHRCGTPGPSMLGPYDLGRPVPLRVRAVSKPMRALPAPAAMSARGGADQTQPAGSRVRPRPVAMWGFVGEKRELFPHGPFPPRVLRDLARPGDRVAAFEPVGEDPAGEAETAWDASVVPEQEHAAGRRLVQVPNRAVVMLGRRFRLRRSSRSTREVTPGRRPAQTPRARRTRR